MNADADDDVVVADNAGTMPLLFHTAAALPNWEVKVLIQPYFFAIVAEQLQLRQKVEDEQFARGIPLPDIDQTRAHSKCKPKSLETASALATAGGSAGQDSGET